MNVQMSDVFFSLTFPEEQKVLVTLTREAVRQLHWCALKRGDFISQQFHNKKLEERPRTLCASWSLL